MSTDISIAQAVELQDIRQIADKIGIHEDQLELYGRYKAKLPLSLIDEAKWKKNKLILVTALSPTPAGEGKTTVSIGLSEGLNKIGKQTIAVLREPSLGPVFGMKGGATGGGYSQVLPMEDINLHFTGDFSAVEKANNLLAAAIDNNIQSRKRSLGIDPRTVLWKRVMDMNDRSLRNIVIGLGGTGAGVPRETGFNITAASEIMAILCMAENAEDLKNRIDNIFVGYTWQRRPVYAKELNVSGAMAALLKDAIKPNLVQTIEGNPAIIHGGPFANIAQGTNTVLATRMGLSLADYVVTEAGFGADLGAEKFLNIKCQSADLAPSAVVVVATVRALKYHGGVDVKELNETNVEAVRNGLPNLLRHISNIQKYNLPAVVAINNFVSDSPEEIEVIKQACAELGVEAHLSQGWAKGGEGTKDLATAVSNAIDANDKAFAPLYDWNMPVEEKIEAIAKNIYGADSVEYSATAKRDLKRIKNLELENLAICMAKTQYSFSDDAKKLGAPSGFTINIREIEIAAGAGFIIPILGKMMRMPGLPATPAAEHIDIDNDGVITGLF